MHDLTRGSIHGHIARLGAFMMVGMVFQTLYLLIDLYFVAQVGSAAVAAVSVAGNLMMVTVGLTQALTVGTTTLVAHAIGAKDVARARRVFNQSQVLATVAGVLFVVATFLLRHRFARALAADAATVQALLEYLDWYLPAMAVQFLLVATSAALRGAGEVRAPMLVGVVSLLINIALAPVLIAGWGTGRPLGVAGAGLASFIAVVAGSALLLLWVRKRHDVLALDPGQWRPDLALWGRMLAIGLPAGGELVLLAVYATLIYGIVAAFGPDAQAGTGIGMRVLQAGFMPGVAIAFALAPIAGQSFGARDYARVRETFRAGLIWASATMLLFMLLCQVSPSTLIRPFAASETAETVGATMLAILAFNFVANGVVFVAGSLFQALGNTLPSLLASASRIVLFAVPALLIAREPWFELRHLWWLSVGSVLLQMVASLLLLRREMARRLSPAAASAAVAVA
jgi:putative MATE family efflux protein